MYPACETCVDVGHRNETHTDREAEARHQEREALAERIEGIEHPCHEVCLDSPHDSGNYVIHADCQCASFVKGAVLSIILGEKP
jgi:hypothetical protein